MKKISLKNLNLKEVEQLSRTQLKGVFGGWVDGSIGQSGGGTDPNCPSDYSCPRDDVFCGDDDRCTCGWVNNTLICTSGFNG